MEVVAVAREQGLEAFLIFRNDGGVEFADHSFVSGLVSDKLGSVAMVPLVPC